MRRGQLGVPANRRAVSQAARLWLRRAPGPTLSSSPPNPPSPAGPLGGGETALLRVVSVKVNGSSCGFHFTDNWGNLNSPPVIGKTEATGR